MRVSYAISVLAAVLLSSGCGADDGSTGKARASPETTATTPTQTAKQNADAWYFTVGQPGRVRSPDVSLAKQLAVFSMPRAENDALPSFEGFEHSPWKVDLGQSRLLLTNMGQGGIDLYAIPTHDGSVCPVLVRRDGELAVPYNCAWHLDRGVYFGAYGDGERFAIYGLIANEITNVQVVRGAQRLSATVGRNGFFFEAKAKALCPTDVDALLATAGESVQKTSLDFGDYSSCG